MDIETIHSIDTSDVRMTDAHRPDPRADSRADSRGRTGVQAALLRDVTAADGTTPHAKQKEKKKFWLPAVRVGVAVPEVGARMTGRVLGFLECGSAVLMLPENVPALLSPRHYSWMEPRCNLTKRLKIGQEIAVEVRKLHTNVQGKTKVKVSHRLTRPNPWEQIDQDHPVGSRTMGQVVEIGRFDIWVELETGYIAKVAKEEISWGRQSPEAEELLEIGAWIELQIMSTDKESRLILASHRRVSSNPWETVEQTHPVGSTAWGVVDGFCRAGMFVELENGLVALVPLLEISWVTHKAQSMEYFKLGDRIEVVIQSTDKQMERICASHRETMANPWEAFLTRHAIGSVSTGIVQKSVNYGLFVIIEDGFVGLLHSSRLGPGAALNVGDTVRVRIIDCNPQERRIALADAASEPVDFASESCEAQQMIKQAA